MTGLGQVSFWVLLSFSFKLDPFIERSETLEKMGAERPGVLVNSNSVFNSLTTWKQNWFSQNIYHQPRTMTISDRVSYQHWPLIGHVTLILSAHLPKVAQSALVRARSEQLIFEIERQYLFFRPPERSEGGFKRKRPKS